MSPSQRHKDDRVFVRNGRRAYRPRHSLAEVRAGLVIVLILGCIGGWIAWKGAHPDPGLFDVSALLLEEGPALANRGEMPEGVASPGWIEASAVSRFDTSNLYEKINRREDYYKSFGFEELTFVSLTPDDDTSISVDIELFDLGNGPNALGAFAGERPPEAQPGSDEYGLSLLDRNALLLTRGRYYVRAIGSDESPEVISQLQHVRRRMNEALPSESLPWAYALFVGALDRSPSDVAFTSENAFSFGFARNVWSALLADGETEAFVVVAADDGAAHKLARQYTDGFLSYGERHDLEAHGVEWVADRYLGAISGAQASGRWVLGVRAAPHPEEASVAFEALNRAVEELPERVVEQAYAAANRATTGAPGLIADESSMASELKVDVSPGESPASGQATNSDPGDSPAGEPIEY